MAFSLGESDSLNIVRGHFYGSAPLLSYFPRHLMTYLEWEIVLSSITNSLGDLNAASDSSTFRASRVSALRVSHQSISQEVPMFTITSRLTALVVTMLLLFFPLSGHTDEGMKGKESHDSRDGGMHQFASHSLHSLLRHAKDLGLSEEQVTKLKMITADYEKAKIRGEADIKLAELDVQTLAHDDKADIAAIENAVRKSETAHSNLRIEGIKVLRAASAVLTPEQQEKWRASRAMMHGGGKDKGDYKAPAAGGQPAPSR
jgi:periplasmic protein CpxP/Spy